MLTIGNVIKITQKQFKISNVESMEEMRGGSTHYTEECFVFSLFFPFFSCESINLLLLFVSLAPMRPSLFALWSFSRST